MDEYRKLVEALINFPLIQWSDPVVIAQAKAHLLADARMGALSDDLLKSLITIVAQSHDGEQWLSLYAPWTNEYGL